MKYVTVKDFRSKSAKVWESLFKEKELIVTSNGHPLAILSWVSEDTAESSLKSIRRAKAEEAVNRIQAESAMMGLSELSLEDINHEINEVRKNRKK